MRSEQNLAVLGRENYIAIWAGEIRMILVVLPALGYDIVLAEIGF